MALMNTTHGLVEESTLARTVGFEDRPNEFVVWVEWRMGEELVRRDAHVILKRPGEEAQAVLGAIAGPNDVTVGLSGVAANGAAGGFE
jgi:hypothetical protein